jgi:hypothetical protein
MSENDEDFFAGKRPWSIIKDQVLQNYMTPYIAKVNKRGNPILLIDGYAGTLFEDTDWRETRSTNDLQSIIINTVAEHPGETRKANWFKIVQNYFMLYLHTEYLNVTQRLIDEKKLVSPTPRKTKRLNDDCILYLP